MSFASLLVNTCTVERYTSIAVDAYGNPIKPWVNHLVGQPCRLSYPKGRQLQTKTEVVPITEMLFMNYSDVAGVNPIEHDRVTVDGILYEILFVATRQDGVNGHHLELDLIRVIK